LIYKRPDTTARVFEALRNIQPAQLFIAADGPVSEKPQERERCEAAREVASNIDWKCDVKKLFREKNLGCKIAVSSAITWFFENVEEGIIIEDDCLPDPSFFWFCRELLQYYRNDKRIMMISGNNFQNGITRGTGSYYFSKHPHIWGWATWRRAWEKYDVNMATYPLFEKENRLANIFENSYEQRYWYRLLNKTFRGEIDTWDYQWFYAVWEQNGLSITPNVNLVSNIGYGRQATRTKKDQNDLANLKTHSLDKIIHPKSVVTNKDADDYDFTSRFPGPKKKKKKLKKLKKLISVDRVKGHLEYGGMRQLSRLILGLFVLFCGKIYFQGKGSKARYCPCCGWEGRRFGPYFAGGYTSLDGVCLECGSHPRQRGQLYYYRDKLKLFEKRGRLLYFAPEKSILPHLSKASGLVIETNDYGKNRDCNHSYDIMNIDAADGTFDYIICHRVIEHIVDDRKAMRELYRILKPGGIAVISVPIVRSRRKTLEYGSPNPLCDLHYYEYGLDFKARIPDGFECTEYLFSELIDTETFKRLSLIEDSIFECRKPERKEPLHTGAETASSL